MRENYSLVRERRAPLDSNSASPPLCIDRLISILKLLISVGIVIVVHERFVNVPQPCPYTVGNTTFLNATDTSCTQTCFLGTKDGVNICSYAYAVAAISILASLALCLLLCFTFNCCGLGTILEVAFCAAGALWWIVAATIFTSSINQGWSDGIVDAKWKNFIQGLAWSEVGLFLIALIIYLWKIISTAGSCLEVVTCCWCCGCCGRERKSGKVAPIEV